MYGNLIVGSGTSCTIGYWYHNGINMHGLGVGHLNDPTCGLNGGPLNEFPPSELSPCESPSCPPFSRWAEPLGTWPSKLTCTMVGTNVVTRSKTSLMSLLVTSWTTRGNWFPTKCGEYVGGTIGC